MVKASTLFIFLEYAPIWVEVFFGVLYFLAVSIVAPFFVASGFAVYLTKRCLLEGWDVELVFKDLRQRYDYEQASPLSEFSNPINSQLDTKNSLVVNERSITTDSEHLLPELETLYDNNGQPL